MLIIECVVMDTVQKQGQNVIKMAQMTGVQTTVPEHVRTCSDVFWVLGQIPRTGTFCVKCSVKISEQEH